MKPPTLYLQRRMDQRSITAREIDEALDNQQTSYASAGHDDRVVVLGETSSGRRLKVVVLRDDPQRVITVADRDSDA